MAARAVEVRGVKIRTVDIPIPVRHGPAFEGERVRKEDMAIEFGGKYTRAFEYLTSRPMDRIEDGLIRVVGPEIADVAEGGRLPLAIFVEVAGRKMQPEFESILERHIHSFLSEPMGVMHLGPARLGLAAHLEEGPRRRLPDRAPRHGAASTS